MTDNLSICIDCSPERNFVTPERLRAHILEFHAVTFDVTIPEDAGSDQTFSISQEDGVYRCPLCGTSYKTKSGCRRHLLNRVCTIEGAENDLDHHLPAITIPELSTSLVHSVCEEELPENSMEPVTIPDTNPVVIPLPTNEPLSTARNHDDAILYSCQQMHASESDKIKTLFIAESLGLSPFALKDSLGAEHNALASPAIIKKLSHGLIHFATAPNHKKRKFSVNDSCRNCSPISVPGMESLLAMSPYANVLRTRTFIELSKPICDLLNEDWDFRPQYRYACAQVLAGCVLMNCDSGQAVMANTVETYGRTKSVDAHREPFFVKKGVAIPTSLPPLTKTRYKDVWPLTITTPDGARLVIGTQSCNALVTSSLRLDSNGEGSVGGTTMSFVLPTAASSNATRIFLDQESVNAALALAADKKAWCISNTNLLCQLRQVKTKFHDASTYLLCRASGDLARSHVCQPYSIFNLINFDKCHSGNGVAAGAIFKNISKEVLQNGAKATLEISAVQDFRRNCTEHSQITTAFDTILDLYPEGVTSIPILGNKDLNKELEVLANLLSSYIATANKSVLTFLQQSFAADNA